MAYNPTTFRNGRSPAITAEELNKFGRGIEEAHEMADDAKPIVVEERTNDPDSSYPEFQIWRRLDLKDTVSSSEYRMYVDGEKRSIKFEDIVSNYPLPPTYTGYLYDNGIKRVEFSEHHASKGKISWKRDYLEIIADDEEGLGISTIRTDLSNVEKVRILWSGGNFNTDHRAIFGVGQFYGYGIRTDVSISREDFFQDKIDYLDLSDFKENGKIIIGIDGRNGNGAIHVKEIEIF